MIYLNKLVIFKLTHILLLLLLLILLGSSLLVVLIDNLLLGVAALKISEQSRLIILPPPMTLLIAEWAISLPAPKAIPWAKTPPSPLNIPPLWGWAVWVGWDWGFLKGAWVWVAVFLVGLGLEPLDPPLEPPPDEIMVRSSKFVTSWHFSKIACLF